jgi:hypothetical protein
MTDSDRRQILASCIRPASDQIVKLSGRWLIRNVEQPGQLLHGPIFHRKRDALDYASRYAAAVFKRLSAELREGMADSGSG